MYISLLIRDHNIFSTFLYQTVTRSSRLLKQAKESIDEHANRSQKLMMKEKLYTEFGEVATVASQN